MDYNLKSIKIKLVDTSKLRSHEEVDKDNFMRLRSSIEKDGILKSPVVADKDSNVVLDGHHRLTVFRQLGIKKIPVRFVDYYDNKIVLMPWDSETLMLTKEDVVNAGTKGKKFPSKTTRHMYLTKRGLVHISEIMPEIRYEIGGRK